jgi:hypothetical protein
MSQQITILVPYVYHNVTCDFIKNAVDQLNIGTITGIDLRPVGDHQQAFIHLDDVDTSNPGVVALNEGQTVQVTYDDHGHYWKMVKYNRRGPSPEARTRAYQMVKEREAREADAIKASMMKQQQQAFVTIMEELATEQAHIDAVVAGKAEYIFEPTPDEQAIKVKQVIDTINNRPSRMTAEEKTALVRKFAEMMLYL